MCTVGKWKTNKIFLFRFVVVGFWAFGRSEDSLQIYYLVNDKFSNVSKRHANNIQGTKVQSTKHKAQSMRDILYVSLFDENAEKHYQQSAHFSFAQRLHICYCV